MHFPNDEVGRQNDARRRVLARRIAICRGGSRPSVSLPPSGGAQAAGFGDEGDMILGRSCSVLAATVALLAACALTSTAAAGESGRR